MPPLLMVPVMATSLAMDLFESMEIVKIVAAAPALGPPTIPGPALMVKIKSLSLQSTSR